MEDDGLYALAYQCEIEEQEREELIEIEKFYKIDIEEGRHERIAD